MGSKISSPDGKNMKHCSDEISVLKHCNLNTSISLNCYTSPTMSTIYESLSPYEVRAKRTKRCLSFDVSESNKENVAPRQLSANSPKGFLYNLTLNKSKRFHKTAEKRSYLASYFNVFDDDVIQDFLWMDCCYKLSDKYLLAMVYTYFRRAELTKREYNRTNFFAALYLSHDMEEDNEDLKLEIFPWVLGNNWRKKHMEFIGHRDALLKRMAYRAAVSKRTCDEVMALCPSHPIWRRERKAHHGGAQRVYEGDDDDDFSPRGPDASPLYCALCLEMDREDTSSPTFTSGYLSSYSLDELSPKSTGVSYESTNKRRYSKKEIFEESDEVLLCREK